MSPAAPKVAVVGLGAMGSATAFQLARRGATVLGLEAFGPAHDRGSSHGESRIIRQAYFEGPGYVPLVLRAYQLWRELESLTSQRLLETTGGVMIGPPEGEVVRGSLESAERWGIPHRLLSADEVHREFPALHPGPEQVGLAEPEAGVLAPELGVLCHLRAAAASGALLHFGERVVDWQLQGGGVRVSTSHSTYEVDRLVLTAGAWSPDLLRLPELSLSVERQVMAWFRPPRIEDFTAPRCPIYLFEGASATQFYGVPTRDGRTAKAAQHHAGTLADPDRGPAQVTEADLGRLRAGLRETIPDLADALIVRSQTCLYTNTQDLNFVVATHPRAPGVCLGAGFSGHGYKFAPAIGEALADLALLGQTALPIEEFQPGRFAAHQSGGNGTSGSLGTPRPSSDITSPIR